MSDLSERIAVAQRDAGERAVMKDLKAKGLLSIALPDEPLCAHGIPANSPSACPSCYPAEMLAKLDELLQTMIIGAEVFTDADGTVTAYKIKTGALHRIVGLRPSLFFPQNMRPAVSESSPQ